MTKPNRTSKALPRYQSDWQQIGAIVPFYQPSNGRTGVLIYYQNGLRECIADCTTGRITRKLAAYFGTSIPQLRQLAMTDGRSRKLPLCYHPQLCLVPVKFRHERGKNHGTVGYLNLPAVARILQNDDGTSTIHFHGSSMPLVALQRKDTICTQLNCGEAIQFQVAQALKPGVASAPKQFPWEQ